MSSKHPESNDSRGEATRTAILDAAEELFAERGFAGTSMRAVADAADTSQPLIHHHFGTKRDLYTAVKMRFTERYRGFEPPYPAPDAFGVGYAAEVMLGYLRFLRENPTQPRLMSWAHLEGDDSGWGNDDEVWRRMAAIVEAARQGGMMRQDVDPALFIIHAAAIVQHWADNRAMLCRSLELDPDDPDLDARYLRHSVALLLRGAGFDLEE